MQMLVAYTNASTSAFIPTPPVLFVMQNFYCLGWGELEGGGIQPGSLGWTLGDRHGTNAG